MAAPASAASPLSSSSVHRTFSRLPVNQLIQTLELNARPSFRPNGSGLMSHRRTVYVVEGDLGARRTLISNLAQIGAEPWPFAEGNEFLGMLEHLAPACVLLDMDLDSPDGLGLLAELVQRRPGWPVVALSGRGD